MTSNDREGIAYQTHFICEDALLTPVPVSTQPIDTINLQGFQSRLVIRLFQTNANLKVHQLVLTVLDGLANVVVTALRDTQFIGSPCSCFPLLVLLDLLA